MLGATDAPPPSLLPFPPPPNLQTSMHGGTPRPMGVQEELLFRNVALAYATLCDSLGHMRFAEHVSVNEAAHELALQCLLPVAQMRHLIKCAAAAAAAPPRPAPLSVRPRARRARYLYYDVLLSYAGWQRHEQGDADSRSRSISALTSLLAEHLCANEDTRWELLEVFARYEVVHKLALRPSYMQTLLQLVQRRMYERALQPHLAARKVVPEPERVLIASWVRLAPSSKRRLVVVTNRAYHLLKHPLGKRCAWGAGVGGGLRGWARRGMRRALSVRRARARAPQVQRVRPAKFCPAGPVLVHALPSATCTRSPSALARASASASSGRARA